MSKKKSKSVKLSKTSDDQEKEQSYKFFNKTDHKNIREDLERELNKIAIKYNVIHQFRLHSRQDDWCDRAWSWKTSFFIKNLERYEETLDYAIVDHYRWWLDQLIDKCSCMVWNLTINTMKEEHKKTGIVPKSPLSKKKGRDSIEAVAEYYANKESNEFEEKFK